MAPWQIASSEPVRLVPVDTDAPTPAASDHLYDVVIVGAGPSGSACAYWLASAGWDVAVVEKKTFPRVKTCGDGLTPRSVRQIADMGLELSLIHISEPTRPY